MKKIIFILFTLFVAVSCKDYNEDNFDWYKDAERPTNVANYELTMTDADYMIIVKALRANKNKADSTLATRLETEKKFSEELDPVKLIPYLLANKYIAMDVNSSAKVTHLYDGNRDTIVGRLSDKAYVLSTDDYKEIWGSAPLVNSLTPAKSPDTHILDLLKKNFADAANYSFKTVEYYYSEEEPVTTIVENKFLEETFEGFAAGSNVAVSIDGWVNKDTKGTFFWQCRNYSNNNYAQVTAYKSGIENEIWLTTKQVNLSGSTATPELSFDIVTGNYNGNGLRILISENYNGQEGGIGTATWTDVTSNFTIPEPASGYSPWASAGTLDLSSYIGKKIYIAFKYIGNDTDIGSKITTTYQLDNIKVSEKIIGTDVEEKTKMSASYEYRDEVWKKVGTNIINMQAADMASFGITNGIMTKAQAANFLPQFLYKNYYGNEGNERVIVYQTRAGEFYADRLKFTGGVWVYNTFINEIITPFAYTTINDVKQWVYDPTIIIPITKSDYRIIVDYVKDNLMEGNEDVWDTRGNAEYYYGFSEYYGNISYREAGYRDKDNTYPMNDSKDEKIAFMNKRTKEAFAILLAIKFPDAVPVVNGVVQKARFENVVIYSEPDAATNVTWTYTFQCIGDKEWEFVSRESNDGRSETASE